MPPTERTYIFGYGSLLSRAASAADAAIACHLEGFRRGWNVAMDNSVTIAGYKYYVDEDTGERPAIYVGFLNIWPAEESRVNGVAYEVDAGVLALLDLRERNYDRHEVTTQIDVAIPGRVWAYIGRPEARERYETGRAQGTAVVSREYHRSVRDAFARVEPAMLDQFERTTDALEVPRRALRRIDLRPQASRRDRPPATSS